jgi:uncharacterized protein YndB with AHSA1/START domain
VQVDRPHRLDYVQTFTDAHDAVARHPGAPTLPEATPISVRFYTEGSTATRVTVRFDVGAAATAEEIATFVAMRSGMSSGWSASFDMLDELLAGVQMT